MSAVNQALAKLKEQRLEDARKLKEYQDALTKSEPNNVHNSVWDDIHISALLMRLADEHFTKENFLIGDDTYVIRQFNRVTIPLGFRLTRAWFAEIKNGVDRDEDKYVDYYAKNPQAFEFSMKYWDAAHETITEYITKLDQARTHVELQKIQFILSRRWRKSWGETSEIIALAEQGLTSAEGKSSLNLTINMNVQKAEQITSEEDMLAKSDEMLKRAQEALDIDYEEVNE